MLLEYFFRKNVVSILRSYSSGLHMKYGVHFVMMMQNACTRPTELKSIQNVLQAYVLYNIWSVMFKNIGSHKRAVLHSPVKRGIL